MSNDFVRTSFVGNSKISIGRYTYGDENLSIKQWKEGASLTIGAFCSLATNITVFLGGNHRVEWISTYPFGHIYQNELGGSGIIGHPSTKGDVIIGNDVWIGAGVTIMSGVRIGDGAVLAANACVVKNVAPYQIVGGNPARLIRQRFSDDIIMYLLKLKWWELPLEDIRNITHLLSSKPDASSLESLVTTYRN